MEPSKSAAFQDVICVVSAPPMQPMGHAGKRGLSQTQAISTPIMIMMMMLHRRCMKLHKVSHFIVDLSGDTLLLQIPPVREGAEPWQACSQHPGLSVSERETSTTNRVSNSPRQVKEILSCSSAIYRSAQHLRSRAEIFFWLGSLVSVD